MAKILLGATLGDARGSVGGVTYTKGRFGAVLRQKVSPVQPRTACALTVRGLFGALSKRWFAVLTDAQRLGWIALAAANPRTNVFGNQIILTGLQMYQSCNRHCQRAGAVLIDDPPANLDVDGLETLSVAPLKAAETFECAFTPENLGVAHHAVFEATLQVNPGRSFVSSYYRFIKEQSAPPVSPIDIHDEYLAVWGALRIGQRITVRMFLINAVNGAACTPLVATALVA